MTHILLLRAGALGDIVLSFPALRYLRERNPEARLTAVGYPGIWELARPLVDDVVSIDAPLFAGLFDGSPSADLQALLHDVDQVIAWTVRDPAPTARAAGVAHIVHASPYPPPGVHAARWLLQTLLETRNGSVPPACPELSPEEMVAGAATLVSLGVEHPVLIHPGAGARWKRWPARCFAAVGDALAQQGRDVIVIAGPADAESVGCMQEHAQEPFPVLRELPPRRLAAVLAYGGLFIGNDSGVTHLAAACGTPTLALFGPTDPASWSPLGTVRVLRACVQPAIEQGQVRVCDDPHCMEQIAVDHVLQAIDQNPQIHANP
jgi:heptosyltransferase III